MIVKSDDVKKTNTRAKAQPRLRGGRGSLHPRDTLKIQRVLVGLTCEELAKRAGVSRTTIEKAESGAFEAISFRDLYAIGVALGVSIALPPGKSKPPATMAEILSEFDQLLVSKRGKIFFRQQPD